MPRVEAVEVYRVPSESHPDKEYRVQYDGTLWYCDCMAWIMNVEHKGEDVPRECKHIRDVLGQKRRGTAKPRIIKTLGPWFEQMQDYIHALTGLAGNGKMTMDKVVKFRKELTGFEENLASVEESVSMAGTMVDVYKRLLKKASESV